MELWIFLVALTLFFIWAGWKTRERLSSGTGPTALDERLRQAHGFAGYRPRDDGKPRS